MKSFIVSVIALLSVMIVPFAAQAQTTAIGNNTTSLRRQSFNTGWTFHLKGSSEQSLVTLPHDAMIESKRDANNPGGSGIAFFDGGVYVYTKHFKVPKEWANKHIAIQFEGVYKKSSVVINGNKAGGAVYGFIPFFVSADGLLNYGGDNTIEVTADNSEIPNSRWYSGGGIYRPVWLWVTDKTYIEPEGVKITTLSYSPAKIRVEVTHHGGEAAVEILDRDKVIASAKGDQSEIMIPNAKLWNDESPYLYSCRVTLKQNGTMKDQTTEKFGIRKIEWSNKGLFVNGQKTLLRGGCIHHDSGILGAATYDESEWRRVRILKEYGFNAIRSAHNPISRAMMEACDALGMYIMDEGWDMWYMHKTKFDYATEFLDNYKSDIKAMVDRDFNHPSVILYSIGNEVSEPAEQKGIDLGKELIADFHHLDNSRPVTGGINLMIVAMSAKGKGVYDGKGNGGANAAAKGFINSMQFNEMASKVGLGMNNAANSAFADSTTTPILDALDIAGYNYASGRYPMEAKLHPNRVVVGSETFPQDIVRNWKMVKELPYLVGDFMWAAWDYLGETGAGSWAYTSDGLSFNKAYPWLLSETGAIDILGNPTGEAYIAQAAWGFLKAPQIAVQPINHHGVVPAKAVWRGTNAISSWSWKNCKDTANVEVYFDAAKVALLINGKKIGEQPILNCQACFKTVYEPGKVEAIAYDENGTEVGKNCLETAHNATLHIASEVKTARPGEIIYLPVTISDAKGIVESNDDQKVSVSVTGGELLSFGSANPRTEESFKDASYTTYYGRALAVVRAGSSGSLKVIAKSGSDESSIIIHIDK